MTAKLESLEELATWEDYRAFVKERLKQLRDGGDGAFLVSKEKVEFRIDGKPWRGHAVLFGAKGEVAARALKKDGVAFREGTCRAQGAELVVQGVPAALVKAGELTLQRLRLGVSLRGGAEDGADAAASDARPDATASGGELAELRARHQELVAELKSAAGLREPANTEVLKQAAARAKEAEAALARGDARGATTALDGIEELLTEVDEGGAGGDEDPDLAGLGDWKAYRAFLKAQLKRLPPEGGPFFVGREKVVFAIEGKAFQGLPVLAGKKARVTVQALKKEGTLFREGTCRLAGKTLEVEGVPAALLKGARKTWLKLRLGRKLAAVGDATADEDAPAGREGMPNPEPGPPDGDEPAEAPVGMIRPFEISASVGRGGKNLEEDVTMVQTALNRRMGAGLDVDGKCGPGTIRAIMEFQKALGQARPDGRVEPKRGTARALAETGRVGAPPPPPRTMAPPDLGEPVLFRAPAVWNGTRTILDNNIRELKRAILQEYSSEHPDLLAEIDRHVQRVDVVLEKLDKRLGDTLERANAAKDERARASELAGAKAILAEYIQFVKTEPLIGYIDKNPFGVDTHVRKVITDSLTHMAKSIGG